MLSPNARLTPPLDDAAGSTLTAAVAEPAVTLSPALQDVQLSQRGCLNCTAALDDHSIHFERHFRNDSTVRLGEQISVLLQRAQTIVQLERTRYEHWNVQTVHPVLAESFRLLGPSRHSS